VSIAKTLTGKSFEYSVSLANGLTVFFKPPHKKKIPVEIINVIRQEITKRSPVLMGANRQPLVGDSVGETLALKHNESPQVMSYVLPLLRRCPGGSCRLVGGGCLILSYFLLRPLLVFVQAGCSCGCQRCYPTSKMLGN